MLTRKFMTVREVADLAQVTEATVRHWIKQGGLRAIDVGREFRIVPRDLEAFFEHHATSTARPRDPGGNETTPRGTLGEG
jgi:excisionase family DNA binding protein